MKNSFDFAINILEQNSDGFMANLDVTSLFTNTGFDETKQNKLNDTFHKKQCISNLDRGSFEKFLHLVTKEPFFIFDENVYN